MGRRKSFSKPKTSRKGSKSAMARTFKGLQRRGGVDNRVTQNYAKQSTRGKK